MVQIHSPRPLFPQFHDSSSFVGASFDSFNSVLCPILCPPSFSTALRTASSDGWTYRVDIPTELCPAILAKVQASQPDSPNRVRNVCLSE